MLAKATCVAEPVVMPFDASRIRMKIQVGLQLRSLACSRASGREAKTPAEGLLVSHEVGSQTLYINRKEQEHLRCEMNK